MAQQLNLNDPRFTPRRLHVSARHTVTAMAVLLVLCFAGGRGMLWLAGQRDAQAREAQTALAPLRSAMLAQARPAPVSGQSAPGQSPLSAAAEVSRLQQLDTAQRRILIALEQGLPGIVDAAQAHTPAPLREGHAGYLQALARQASPQLWLTGFSVSEDGRDIDLEGRMSDAKALPDYLRRLNAEPHFKGRPFAQLSLKAVDTEAGNGLAYTAFSLRSSASGPAKP